MPLSSQELQSKLWQAADILRGQIDAADYKNYIFSILFLKRLSDRFNEEVEVAVASGVPREVALADRDEHEVFVPEEARWPALIAASMNVGEVLNVAGHAIEEANTPRLDSVLTNTNWNDESKLGSPANRERIIRSLLNHFSALNLRDENLQDMEDGTGNVLGDAYEYLIYQFADDAGKKGGEFYTPRSVVRLIVELLRPSEGMRICDPTAGSAGMLIYTAQYVKEHGGDHRNLALHGQERNLGTLAIGKLNLLLHGQSAARLEAGDVIAEPGLIDSSGRLLSYDRVIANPPFSLKSWGHDFAPTDPHHRFDRFGAIPPRTKGDLAFLLHMLAVTNSQGMVGVVMPHGFEGLSFFASNSAPLAGYDVHTCVGIPNDALESVPRFNNPKKDDYYARHIIVESFARAVIDTCLMRADRALYLPYPGEGLMILGDHIDIVRSSATRFVNGVTFALTQLAATDLFRFANEVSSLTYERSGAKGHLVVTDTDNLANKLKVTIQNPVRLGEARSVRKMLELTDETTALLTDGQAICGLGECISAPDVARIIIEGHAKWSLSINDTALIRVAYEHATLPKQILDKGLFGDVARRKVNAVEVDRIWDIFQCALDNGHGTTIVVSEDPVAEVKRLGHEALAIKPEYLDHKDIARLGRIDGAILLGPDGCCHAFGVILDGQATSSGDRARGARFNSSVRYQRTSKIGTMVIVISDDGTVDLIPNLMPRVSRQEFGS